MIGHRCTSAFCSIVLLLSIYMIASAAASRSTPQPHQQGEMEDDVFKQVVTHFEDEEFSRDASLLRCSKDDDGKEEKCMEERMMGEAHLDYIYTQHINP